MLTSTSQWSFLCWSLANVSARAPSYYIFLFSPRSDMLLSGVSLYFQQSHALVCAAMAGMLVEKGAGSLLHKANVLLWKTKDDTSPQNSGCAGSSFSVWADYRSKHARNTLGGFCKMLTSPATDFCGDGANLSNSCKTYIMSLNLHLVQSSCLWKSNALQKLSHKGLTNPCIPVIICWIPIWKVKLVFQKCHQEPSRHF